MRNGTRVKTLAIMLTTVVTSTSAIASTPRASAEMDFSTPEDHRVTEPRDQSFTVSARVLKVTPIIRHTQVSEPTETCRLVTASRYNSYQRRRGPIEPPHRVLRSVIGSLIGGAIGNRVGDGRGRKAATVAGALAGAHIANRGSRDHYRDRYDYRDDRDGEVIEQCTQTSRIRQVEQIDGYRVRYRYNGQTFHKTMDYDPGEELELTARISPQNHTYNPQ